MNNKSKNPIIKYKKNNKNNKKKNNSIDLKNNKNCMVNNDLNEIIKIIPINNTIVKDTNPINKMSDIFDKLLKNSKAKNEFKSLDKIEINPELVYEENNDEINNLQQLINFSKNIDINKNFSFDVKKLKKLISPLEELKTFVGMENIKNSIIKQILYFLQNLDTDSNMMHTVITGLPGLGKTKLGYLLAEIYYKMNVFRRRDGENKYISPITNKEIDFKFTIARRSDLIGEYVGHTAIKTQNLIDKALGGVLFIDEAYSVGNIDKKDTFSKECIDTINQNLTENKDKFLVIVAGYEDELESCFFNYNPGLQRRFAFRYNIEPYNFEELGFIFINKLNEWKISDELKMVEGNNLYNFFKSNYNDFPNYGGDMESLFLSVKIAHSLRIFCKNPNLRKILIFEDIKKGFKIFKDSKKKDIISGYKSMYL